MVNRGIYLNGDAGATFLHFGSYENSCISDPALCGPQGEACLCTRSLRFSFSSISLTITVPKISVEVRQK